MIGLVRDTVKLSPHCDQWAKLYQKEKKNIIRLIKEHILDIQHIGSTSIFGIKAKPIIDIAVLIDKSMDFRKIRKILERDAYLYRGDHGENGGQLFVKSPQKDYRTHHIHFIKKGEKQWNNYIDFRDRLNQNYTLAAEYNALKEMLEQKFPRNRGAYTKGKSYFINKVIL